MGIDSTTPAHISLDVAELKRDSSDFLRLQRPSSLMAGKRHGIDVQADYEEPEFSAHEIKATPVDDNMAEAAGRPVKTLEDTERETIIRALDRNHGKRKKTAMELNISERTLYRKIKEYGLESRNNN
jgi:DNA-binding NtrC family response regulator